ncbi:hypothetical protein J1614_000934 [Plenodomus biglobosus]|nr:hypothetical protein J1614_000934 [Plenodomus biglobosus]
MVHGLLFKWEDSAALKHHCGFCERPLNHPGARASCFGKHSEPCVRYHQAMFMRLRSHTCTYCLTIEEAHYKRHTDIADKVRGLYESCGELDWTIIPSEPYERGRARVTGDRRAISKDGGSDPSPTSEDTPTSKREKKDAKNLARAASRSRVITLDEVQYVDSVIHLTEGVNDNDGPRNPEEIEEIERHLRYHAQVYNTQPDRRGLQKMAQFPDADIDFDAEMDRIMGIFRITELVKRNTRNRGLQGREMKNFEALLEEFKCAVVEDIVLVKKDVLEVRMRRAGYMRYTNKTAFALVEDRYIDKDWKTGERLNSSASDTSGSNTPFEEINLLDRKENMPSTPQQQSPARGPDRRHLEAIHTRVSGEDGLYGAVIEPYNAPLVNLAPDPSPNSKPISLKLVINDASKHSPRTVNEEGDMTSKTQPVFNGWNTVTSASKTTLPPKIAKLPAGQPKPLANAGSSHLVSGLDSSSDYPGLPLAAKHKVAPKVAKAPSVQRPLNMVMSSSTTPEEFINNVDDTAATTAKTYPLVSQKKKAKKEREAKRKARKVAVQGELSLGSPDVNAPVVMQALNAPTMHMHWLRFTRYLIVDQLTSPLMVPWHTPHNGTPENGAPCPFERNSEPDCPFHDASLVFGQATTCACCAHRNHLCHLVFPGDDAYSFGPLDRIRCEKLMDMYENDRRTQGRLMLVDDLLYDHFLRTTDAGSGASITESMPKALAREYTDFFDKHQAPGPLMLQEHAYHRLAAKNRLLSHPISAQLLRKMQLKFEPKNCIYTCYCHTKVVPGLEVEDTIECSHRDCKSIFFHKACVKKQHHEDVTRWYCTACSQKMKALARDTLSASGHYVDAEEEKASCELHDQEARGGPGRIEVQGVIVAGIYVT